MTKKQDSFCFPHDCRSTNDLKLTALIGKFGASGYGIYWRIVEMLHIENTHKLPHKKYIYLAISEQMLVNIEQVESLLSFAIEDCELFISDGNFFWSNWVMDNISKRAEISEKRSIAAKQKGKPRQILISDRQKRDIFKKPTSLEIKEYADSINFKLNADTFFDFYESKGWMVGKNKMKDWKAAVRTWQSKNPAPIRPTYELSDTMKMVMGK